MNIGDQNMNIESTEFLSMIKRAYEKGSTEEMTVKQLIEEIKEDLQHLIKA